MTKNWTWNKGSHTSEVPASGQRHPSSEKSTVTDAHILM